MEQNEELSEELVDKLIDRLAKRVAEKQPNKGEISEHNLACWLGMCGWSVE